MRELALALGGLVCSSSFALTPESCSFYAPFDGSFEATHARGSAKATVKGTIQFVPGLRGQGILVGAPGTGISYETKGNLDLEAGSVSVWVKPETWDDMDAAMRFFFTLNEGEVKSPADGGTFLWLYRFFSRSTYFLVWDSRGYPTLAAADPKQFPDVFKKGQWVHLLGAWNGDELRLFINGKSQGASRVSTPRILRSLASTFSVGDPNRANAPDTLLDEFRLFDRALTAPEAEALCKFDLQAVPEQQQIAVVRLPGAKKVRVDLNALAHKPSEASGLSATVALSSKDGSKVLQEKRVERFDTNRAAVEFSTANLAVGEYRVISLLREDEKELATTEATFAVNASSKWLGSRVGFTDKVPEPWTPLSAKGDGAVSCWGPRQYDVGNALFPGSLSTLGKEVLASPITLTGIVNGAPLRLGQAKTKWTKKAPARVQFAAIAASGDITAATSTFVEYDGLLWTTLILSAKRPLRTSKLTLDIPLRKEAATLMQTGFGVEDAGAIRRWSHRVLANAQIWLGNEDGGLQVTIPSARNWRSSDRNHQIEILPEADRVILRLNLVDKESVFDGGVSPTKKAVPGPVSRAPRPNPASNQQSRISNLEYSFGLQLTPVRPHPKGWRMWRITPPDEVPGTRFAPFYTEGWAVGTSYPIPGPGWEKLYNDATKKGNVATLYLQPFCIWPGTPDYPDFAAEWRTNYCNTPARHDPQVPPTSFMGVCPRPRSWGDYFVTTFCDLYQGKYKDMGWGAVYFDVTPTPTCDNADHGCGYVDEFGVRQPEQRYLEHREVQRRFYVAMQERWPNKLMFNHESGQLDMTQLAFCHGMIDGEHLCLALPPDNFNYYKILTLDRMRAEFMGHNFGFVPIFLPEFTRAASGNDKVMAHFMENPEPPEVLHLVGLLLLHDILPWDAWSNPTAYFHLWTVQDAFGWGDEVELLPYWRNRDLVTLSPSDPNIVCTLYLRPRKLMIVVMNNTDEDREVTLQLNEEKLGLRASFALDSWKAASFKGCTYSRNPQNKEAWIATPVEFKGTEEVVPVASGRLTVKVVKRSFRILTLP